MAVTIGTTATSTEVKARWAYAEISSARFGKGYAGHGPAYLHALARGGTPFSAVDPRDWPHLVDMAHHGRNKDFVDNVDSCGSPTYRCDGWQMTDLLGTLVLPTFGRVPYPTFLTKNPSIVLKSGMPVFDDADPRVVAWSIDPNLPFDQVEPIIIIKVDNGRPMILEGYLRSLLWLRMNDPSRPLLAWLPV